MILDRARQIHLLKLGKGPTKTLDEIDKLIAEVNMIQTETVEASQLVVLSDPGRDLDDECAMIMLAALSSTPGCLVQCKAFIATLAPVPERVRLARGTLDILGLYDIPVGIGSKGGVETLPDDFSDTAGEYMSKVGDEDRIEDGQCLLLRVYEAAEDNSLDFVIIASMMDAAIFIKANPDLFKRKTRSVLIMGGVEDIQEEGGGVGGEAKVDAESSAVDVADPGLDEDRIVFGYIKPDSAHNNSISMDSAEFVYRRVQELGVQLIVLTRWVAYACPVPRETYEAMAATSHVVAKRLLRVQQAKIEGLWSHVSWPIGDKKVRLRGVCGGGGAKREGRRRWVEIDRGRDR
jgi:hypothetical protein